jgi:DNA-binding transcriptional LysR family regulator
MTLEQLRIFVAVAQHQHVTHAARELDLTQSATSAAIAALENRYETKLFDRIGRRIVLTEAGRLFLVRAKAVLAESAAAETALSDLAGLKRGSLKLAASQTVGNYWLPRLIHRFRSRHPGITVSLSLGNTETVAVNVQEADADLGFVEGAVDDPMLTVRAIAEDSLVLVVAPDHAWARRPPSRPQEFRSIPWVCREPGSGTRAMLIAALPVFGVEISDLDIALELPSNEAICAAIEAGAGAAVVSRLVAERALASGSLAAVDIVLPTRSFAVLRHKQRHVTRASEAFYAMVVEKSDPAVPATLDSLVKPPV